MAKDIPWVSEEKKTGRLLFRRSYPADVRGSLGWEKKVTLGANRRMTEAASRVYYMASDDYDREVREARLAAKKAAEAFDTLTPEDVRGLVQAYRSDRHASIAAKMMEGGDWASRASEGLVWTADDLQRWKVEADYEEMEGHWGKTADRLLAKAGFTLSSDDEESRHRLLWALNDAGMERQADDRKQLSGKFVEAPPKPAQPKNPLGRARTVSALVSAYKLAQWDRWAVSSRKGVDAPFRVLEQLLGTTAVNEVDREAARAVFEAVKALPVSIGKNRHLKGLTVLEAIERGKTLGIQTISPKTVNGSYMAFISSAFEWAHKERWIDWNPFKGLAQPDPIDERDKRDAFTSDQLQELFTAAPWDRPRANDEDAQPGRYWVPLIALFTGMRLGEICGLRIADVETIDGEPCFRVRRYEGRSIKTAESRRDVPVPQALRRLGLLAFVGHQRQHGTPDALLFPDGDANNRQQWGAKLSERFVKHLARREITGTKLGMHSFRHGFEDRLKAAGLSGTAEALAVSGRAIAGSQSIYGTIGGGFPIANLLAVLEKLTYPGLDLSHLEPDSRDGEGA
ncbi:site-specific integrase [Sphingomonas sp. BAUL-RG-20F-R05-02]|uniref:site-specific integrase n=1 Tax=Sphingomonas sp. BAUL-RG-20F-R05-02 TaxID=2914830 RepID=UPI001F5880F4|nr:site-specific integrase [Sphingomonas sp. BAUL-RG-20F-R05-02]